MEAGSYSPCDLGNHQAYSEPSIDKKSGWEVRYYYDAAPRDGTAPFTAQYTTGRLVVLGSAPAEFNGSPASIPGTTATNQQIVRTSYTARGVVRNVDGSYGTLVKSITRRADGLVENLVYGDAAGTTTATTGGRLSTSRTAIDLLG